MPAEPAPTSSNPRQLSVPLSRRLRLAARGTAAINSAVGVAFILGPELGINLWPSPVSPVLTRFMGAIIVANGVGAWMVARQGTWEGARVLFIVGIVYGALVVLAVTPQLLSSDVDRGLWAYVVFSVIFLVPLVSIFWSYERRSREPA